MIARREALALIGAGFAFPVEAIRANPAYLLISAARRQVGITLAYDPAYSKLAFPGGDVARSKGVCTDVVIRAYRDGLKDRKSVV